MAGSVRSRDGGSQAALGGVHGRTRLPGRAGRPRTVTLVGLRLPVRASVAIAVVTFALLFDYSRTFIPGGANAGRGPDAMLATSIERVILFGLVPLAGRPRSASATGPSRYGLTIGEWRWGAALVLVGCAVMTPIVLWFATMPDVARLLRPRRRRARPSCC